MANLHWCLHVDFRSAFGVREGKQFFACCDFNDPSLRSAAGVRDIIGSEEVESLCPVK